LKKKIILKDIEVAINLSGEFSICVGRDRGFITSRNKGNIYDRHT
jgi:hypothetical protein